MLTFIPTIMHCTNGYKTSESLPMANRNATILNIIIICCLKLIKRSLHNLEHSTVEIV